MKAIEAMKAMSEKIGWPEFYKDDLKHDFAALEKYKLKRFGWVLRQTGTHLIFPIEEYGLRERWYSWSGAVLSYLIAHQMDAHPNRFFLWDGKELTETTGERLKSVLSNTAGFTKVTNLRTQAEAYYSCSPDEAVVAAYAQSLGDWNTWDYGKYKARRGEKTWSCGDWCAMAY